MRDLSVTSAKPYSRPLVFIRIQNPADAGLDMLDRPVLNRAKPAILCTHPKVGLAVFEEKSNT